MELFPSFASVLMTDPFFRPLNLRPQQQQQARASRFAGASLLCDVTDKVDKFEVLDLISRSAACLLYACRLWSVGVPPTRQQWHLLWPPLLMLGCARSCVPTRPTLTLTR